GSLALRENAPCCPDRVERVALAARTPFAPQAPHLEHPLALAAQEAAEASPERAGSFDRERAPPRRVLFPELYGARIAAAVRLNARLEHDRARSEPRRSRARACR